MPDSLSFNYQKEFFFNFYLLHFSLFFAFVTVDVFLFYIAFELVLVPLFYLIGRYGSGQRRIRASYLFFFYTLIGSLGLLLVLIYMLSTIGTTHLHYLLALNFFGGIPFWFQQLFFVCFFIRMAVKVPLFPVHLWLPEAHVEAPTVGSVLLAGILLKLGTYGFFRFVFSVFFPVVVAYQNFFVVFLSLGFVLASFSTVRQRDMKRVIAYSSVSHMTMVILGLFLLNRAGIYGSLFLMFSHGFISSALFFLVGVVYRRYHTRLIKYFSGLRSFMPYFAFFFLYFSLANMRFPGTAGFIGEFLVVVAAAQWNFVIMFFIRIGMFINRVYSLWLRNRILFGLPLREYIVVSIDLTSREFVVLFTLFLFTFFLGIFPMTLFDVLESALTLI
jgi:NADH-quinone oxidoreductase subunit M